MSALARIGDDMEEPRRKRIRIPEYDYSSNGAYFITACTHNKVKLFGEVGEDTPAVRMIQEVLEETVAQYPEICCPKYVVMPNHIHAILLIDKLDADPGDTVADVMRAFKSKSTVGYIRLVKEGKAMPFDRKVWQRSYFDHVIRNEQDYQEIWNYIDNNPARWLMGKMEY